MKAVVLNRPQALQLMSRECPHCPLGGVLIAVKACGICSADLRMVQQGHRALVYPRILGHEIVGQIVESRHPDWAIGQAVQVAPGLSCGQCRACVQGKEQRCSQVAIHGFSRDGGFAEYLAVPLRGALVGALIALPPEISWPVAALAEPLACCFNAQAALKIGPQHAVWIAGAGPLGLLHLMLARQGGASWIGVSDVNPFRCQQALALGADLALDASRGDTVAHMISAAGGTIDRLILATSAFDLTSEVLAGVSSGGRIALFSSFSPQAPARNLDFNLIHYRELHLIGSYGCSTAHNRQAVAFLQQHSNIAGNLITWRGDLADIHAGLVHLQTSRALKAMVEITSHV